MPLGGLVSLAILLPNILWMFFPPASLPAAQAGQKSPTIRLLEIAEGIGRLGVFAIPFFYPITIQSSVVYAFAGYTDPYGALSCNLFSGRVGGASIVANVDGRRRVGHRTPCFELARISTVREEIN